MNQPSQWIAAYGDSTQWGTDNHHYTPANAPAYLNGLLKVKWPDAVVVNRGVPAMSTSKRWSGDGGTGSCSWEQEMSGPTGANCNVIGNQLPCGTSAPYVVNNTTINDIAVDKAALSTAQFKALYQKIIVAAKERHTFVIETPNPVLGLDADHVKQFNAYVVALHELSSEQGVALIDQYVTITTFLPAGSADPDYDWTRMMSDGPASRTQLHPKPELYAFKALNSFWTFYHLMEGKPVPALEKDKILAAWKHLRGPNAVYRNPWKQAVDALLGET